MLLEFAIRVRGVISVFAGDVARAIVAACASPLEDGFETVNIGTGIATSIGELAELVAQLCGAPSVEYMGECRPAGVEVGCLLANAQRARRVLGWQAATTLGAVLNITWKSMVAA